MTDEEARINARFKDNPALKGREDKFMTINAKVPVVLASWRESLFAHEWIDKDGHIKPPFELSEKIRLSRQNAISQIDSGETLIRPVLGLGITDTVEIGAGRDLFLVLASRGIEVISVHIPKSHQKDFKIFST